MDFINWLLNPKNACKDIKKTIFLDFLYLRILNHVVYFIIIIIIIIYANIIYFLFFERLGHMQFKIKFYIFLKERFCCFCRAKLIKLIPKKHLA